MSKEDFVQVIENCNSMEDVFKAESLFYDLIKEFKKYDAILIQIYFAKRKDELVNIP